MLSVSIHFSQTSNEYTYAQALYDGFVKHGITPDWRGTHEPAYADIACFWSWRRGDIIRHQRNRGRRCLLMERGHLHCRKKYTSLGFDGLCGLGKYANVDDKGARFNEHWGHLLKPWQYNDDGYVLLLGQVPNDMALHGININHWILETAGQLVKMGYRVRYRPHPVALQRRMAIVYPPSCEVSRGTTLEDDLNGARFCVTYNSTSAVESVLHGVPCVTMHQGSMAWDVTSHDLNHQYRPLREKWAHKLAWAQFTKDEMASGFAWDVLKHEVDF